MQVWTAATSSVPMVVTDPPPPSSPMATEAKKSHKSNIVSVSKKSSKQTPKYECKIKSAGQSGGVGGSASTADNLATIILFQVSYVIVCCSSALHDKIYDVRAFRCK